jgi:hypothetical protein
MAESSGMEGNEQKDDIAISGFNAVNNSENAEI